MVRRMQRSMVTSMHRCPIDGAVMHDAMTVAPPMMVMALTYDTRSAVAVMHNARARVQCYHPARMRTLCLRHMVPV